MSQYLTLRTQIKSIDHLVCALKDLGFHNVEVHETPQKLKGWLGDVRKNTAEVIIRKKYVGLNSNDIGFKRSPDGRFEAVISEFDESKYGVAWLNQLTQRYAYHVALDTLKHKDFDLINETVEGGNTIHLTLRRMAF